MKHHSLPLRVDFAGGWLDVPKFARSGGYIVNCAITPKTGEFCYKIGGGLGGSAAKAIMDGKDAILSECETAGWQDPAVIMETGLCIWKSGPKPYLFAKYNPHNLAGKMALTWTKKRTKTTGAICSIKRDYDIIQKAGVQAAAAVLRDFDFDGGLGIAINTSYESQLKEGMEPLPNAGIARKYCGSGHGGYALYLFTEKTDRDLFCRNQGGFPIEPYMERFS